MPILQTKIYLFTFFKYVFKRDIKIGNLHKRFNIYYVRKHCENLKSNYVNMIVKYLNDMSLGLSNNIKNKHFVDSQSCNEM